MRHTLHSLALGGALAFALAACSTDMTSRTDSMTTTSGGSAVQATGSGSSTPDLDGLHNNNGNGEAGTTPMPGSLGATAGEQTQ